MVASQLLPEASTYFTDIKEHQQAVMRKYQQFLAIRTGGMKEPLLTTSLCYNNNET